MYNQFRGRGRGFHPLKIVFFLLVMAGFALALGGIVMWLWNKILPPVTGVAPLTYWQAVGLFVLSRILFGTFRFGPPFRKPPGYSKRKYWKEKWMNMTEEEKKAFKEKWKKRC